MVAVAFAGKYFSVAAHRILSAAAVNSCPHRTFAFSLSVAARIHYDYEDYCYWFDVVANNFDYWIAAAAAVAAEEADDVDMDHFCNNHHYYATRSLDDGPRAHTNC